MKKKIIIVTGSSGSVGKQICNFLEKNNIVIKIDRTIPKKKINFYKCDLNNYSSLEKIFKKIKKKYNFINCLINCAGLIHSELFIRFDNEIKTHSEKNWKNTFENNLYTTFNSTKCYVQNFAKSNNHEKVIINFSSLNAEGVVGQSAYASSKSAIETFTKVLSKELGILNIRVACIAPGFFDVSSTINNTPKKIISKVINNTPLKRLGKIHELTKAINFIINNKFFNGKVLKLDGGL